MTLNYLTKERLAESAQQIGSGHWDCTPLDRRWDYHHKAITLLRHLHLKNPADVLEMGTMGVQLVQNSHTLDYADRWDFPGKKPTYLHDGRETPWPIADKQYRIFIALRVFQHLVPRQKEAFLEARRIARRVLIVVDPRYQNPVLPMAKGITYDDFTEWNNGIPCAYCTKTAMGDLYYWDDSILSANWIRFRMRGGFIGQVKQKLRAPLS